jgi:hypothetical protein
VEIALRPSFAAGNTFEDLDFDLGNGVIVKQAELEWHSASELVLTVFWENGIPEQKDYSVAVHLVSSDPPAGPQDILAQADQTHPVEGWYPVSGWQNGEVVRDMYSLDVPDGAVPAAVRLSMYRVGDDGSFQNTNWLSLDIPPREADDDSP